MLAVVQAERGDSTGCGEWSSDIHHRFGGQAWQRPRSRSHRISDGSFAGRNGSGYYSTGDPSDLEAIYDSIATVLKNMYIVGWYTTGDPGEIVDVAITVSYACANGLFTDTFSVQYLVPEQ